MTEEQLETLRRQISVYATICQQLVEMHKASVSQQASLPGPSKTSLRTLHLFYFIFCKRGPGSPILVSNTRLFRYYCSSGKCPVFRQILDSFVNQSHRDGILWLLNL